MEEIKRPTLFDQIKTLGEAVKNWTVKDSFKVVSPETLEFRKNTCNACEHWDKEAFGGIGKCKACGCSAAKLYIPSSYCPLPDPKWKAVASAGECKCNTNAAPLPEIKKREPLIVTGKTEPKVSNA